MIIVAKYPEEVWKKVKLSQKFAKVLRSSHGAISKVSTSLALKVENEEILPEMLSLLKRYGADFLLCEIKEGEITEEITHKETTKRSTTKKLNRKRKTHRKVRKRVSQEVSTGVGEMSTTAVAQSNPTLEDFF